MQAATRRGTLYSLGSVNADFQVRVEARPGSAETLQAHHFTRLSGGKAANVAFLARKLGHEVHLLGCVGRDDLASQALDALVAAGVDVEGVARVPGPTGTAMIAVPPDGKKHILLATNANDAWSEQAADAARQRIESAAPPALLAIDCEIPAPIVARALDAAAARALPVVLDPSFADRVDPAWLPRLLAITPNLEEAAQLGGVDPQDRDAAVRAAHRLRAGGTPLVFVKLPDGGCLFECGDGGALIEAPPVEVVDATGAGDAFTAALAVALLEEQPPIEAARFAVACSTCAVRGYGSQPSYPDRDEVELVAAAVHAKAGDGADAPRAR